eukprot:TRINITY_DN930_c0_g1_i1.p1 TRINITY_DN930_c0_g1~~TRINITY_DN930_c0_g1_i1.p1  ORF type:complete len:590 (-),score=153.11 TRINITY_DN930_c0_g1_i1:24-1793(-)
MKTLALLSCLFVFTSAKYVYHVNSDSNQDLYHVGLNSFEDLSRVCDADPNCKGFNTDGWLKKDVSNLVASQLVSIWAKETGPAPAPLPMIWPEPQMAQHGSSSVRVSSSLDCMITIDSPILKGACSRYRDLIFTQEDAKGDIVKLLIKVSNASDRLDIDTDESYSLTISENSAEISSKTIYGAMHALETFSQLVQFDFNLKAYVVHGSPWNITDFPQFPHRGLLVDTSRHFLPLRTLRQVIDSLSYAKMNVLHWHIVDAQSFPLESKTFPKLWEGSWSPKERYTQKAVAEIVEYAKHRGVRVMPEFDGPGHAFSWGTGYPELLPADFAKSPQCSSECPVNPCDVPLDPTNNFTYTVIDGLFRELTGGKQYEGVFTDDFFHLGGDEVQYACWSSSPAIQAYMKSTGKSYDDLYMDYVKRAHDIILSFGRTPVNWEEVFNHFGNKLNPKTVIHIWLDHATLAKVVAAGYRGILSNDGVWYLDGLETSWVTYYTNDPYENIPASQQHLVLGGQTCMWGETADPSDIFARIWPKSAAAAERLWTYNIGRATSDPIDTAVPRLNAFRCHLLERGIGSAPVFSYFPNQPGSCSSQ